MKDMNYIRLTADRCSMLASQLLFLNHQQCDCEEHIGEEHIEHIQHILKKLISDIEYIRNRSA